MARPSLREKILEAGVTVVHERGFASAGIREIAAAAGAPQGSFSNHFASKDAFGLAVIDRYVERVRAIMDATLRDRARPPIERLRAYFDVVIEQLRDAGWRYGCLVGNLGLEAAEHSEALRERLARALAEFQSAFAEAVRAAQAAGEIRRDIAADPLAALLLSGWYGAMLRMKVDRSPLPLDLFKQVFLATLLAPPTPQANEVMPWMS